MISIMFITHISTQDSEPLQQFVEGVVYPQALIGAEQTDQLRVVYAHFEAGGRNLWHTHGFDQALFITDGEGIVATKTRNGMSPRAISCSSPPASAVGTAQPPPPR